MDKGLMTAGVLLGLLAAGLLYHFAKSRLPGMVMPYAELPEPEQRRVAGRKLALRCAALAFFFLAASLLFTGMPRGSAVLAAGLGFVCQYNVLRLRRRYPMQAVHLMRASDGPSSTDT